MRKGAFTLIELLVFLSLLLVVVVITAPRLYFFQNYLLKHELTRIFATFTYLQQKSIACNKKITLTLEQANNSYSYIFQDTTVCNEQLSNGIVFGFIPGVMGPPGNPSQKIETPINLEQPINNYNRKNNSTINLWPDGRITPCTIYLSDKSNKYMGALTCSVSQVSYIRMYMLYNSKWKILEN
jgi:type II secretory pathway pseudopilin PulG